MAERVMGEEAAGALGEVMKISSGVTGTLIAERTGRTPWGVRPAYPPSVTHQIHMECINHLRLDQPGEDLMGLSG